MTEFLTFLGIAVSLVLGIWNLLQTRKTQFINTVTSERVKWIQELRKNISDFSGSVHTWVTMYPRRHPTPEENKDRDELLARVDRLRYLIRLQLNPNDQLDSEIESLLQQIPDLASQATLDPVMEGLDSLTRKTQALLKKEWEKVKNEATQDVFPDACRHSSE